MDILRDNTKRLFFKYLSASFAGALVSSVYTLVDCIMVGQYEGPNGSAALAAIMPIWSMIFSLGLLFGIGGAVLMSAERGAGRKAEGDGYFTCALLGIFAATAVVWSLVAFRQEPLLRLFGADDVLLPLAQAYLEWITPAIPLFMVGQVLAVFLRNDGVPGLVSIGTATAGIFNIVGDYYFVFVRNMGIRGAGLATAIGQGLGFLILLTHFFTRRCQLRLNFKAALGKKLLPILSTGFPTFLVDIAVGVMTALFNRQIMVYFGGSVLAVYGVVSNTAMTVQAFGYAVGQAAQPLISVNYGAGNPRRIRELRRLGFSTICLITTLCCAVALLFPRQLTALFMDAPEAVLALAPGVLRRYCLSFPLLGFNVFASFYFQAVLQARLSTLLSLLRSLVLSGALVYLLPLCLGGVGLWWVMPVTELLTALCVAALMRRQGGLPPRQRPPLPGRSA